MKSKKALLLLAVIIFTQVCVTFGQYVQNFQGIYPVADWRYSTTNFTLTDGVKQDGFLLATNPSISSTRTNLLAIKLDDYFNIQFVKYYAPIISGITYKIETKDAINTSDNGYIICGNINYGNGINAFIAKFDDGFNFTWGKTYPSITYLNSITEIIYKDDIRYKFVAVGSTTNVESTAKPGVILCIDDSGNPNWEYNTVGYTRTDQFVYNQVVPVLKENELPDFAVVGNSIIGNNKDIIVTKVDVYGNNIFSYLYGNQNNLLYTYTEEGNGICTSMVKDELVICGRTKCLRNNLVRWDDVILYTIDKNNGNISWQQRYDLPLNAGTGEFAQNVISFKEDIYVNGFYESTVFTPNKSIDAFLLKTTYEGNPLDYRVFGDLGEDKIFRLMMNNKEDGITNAGFSSSYHDGVSRLSYAPYVVESYEIIKEKCHDAYFDVRNYAYEMPINEIKGDLVETHYATLNLREYEIPVRAVIPCEKVLYKDNKVMSVDNKSANNISIYPTITNKSINVTGVNGNVEYKIYSSTGNLVISGNINGTDAIDVSSLSSGMYFIIFADNTNFKFIKE